MKFILHRLSAHNFKQLTDVNLRFPERGTILIEGHNEAGKSSLFEALYFALYGKTHQEGQNHENLTRYGETTLRVELEFSIGERRFTVRRSLSPTARTLGHRVELEYPGTDGKSVLNRSVTSVKTQLQEEISLTSEALTNTCFVAQKKLGNLETLSRQERETAINELLNLKIISDLQKNFVLTPDEKQEVQHQQARVEIARLDDRYPDLLTQREKAERCLLYAQMLVSAAQERVFERKIAGAEESIVQFQSWRDAIAEVLGRCNALKAKIGAIDSDLLHCLRAWKEAESQFASAKSQMEKLEALAATLPENERFLSQTSALGEQLATLEALEGETETQSATLQQLDEKRNRYDEIESEWRAGNNQIAGNEIALETLRTDFQEKETRLTARQQLRYRLPQLELLLSYARNHQSRLSEAETFTTQLTVVRESVVRLPEIRETQTALETAEQRLQKREKANENLGRVEAELKECDRRAGDHLAHLDNLAGLAQTVEAHETQVGVARETEADAKTELERVTIRLALQEWVKAAELVAQSDPRSADITLLETQKQEAEKFSENAQTEAKGAKAKILLGSGMVGGAVLFGIMGVCSHFLILVALAGVAAVCGVLPVVAGIKTAQKFREFEEKARGEVSKFEGRLEEAQAQVALFDREKATRATHEIECRRRLEAWGETVPANPAGAIPRLAELPQRSLHEAQKAHQTALAQVHRVEVEATIARQNHENQRKLLQAYDAVVAESKIAVLRGERDALTKVLNGMADLPEFPAAIPVEENLLAVQERLKQVRQEIADATAGGNRIEELERQVVDTQRNAVQEAEEAERIAVTLALPGHSLIAWNEVASEERNRLREEFLRLPDLQIEEEHRVARRAKENAEHALTTLRETQNQRQRSLKELNRPRLDSEHAEIERTLAFNREQQMGLQDVRPSLRKADLPTQTDSLQSHISTLKTDLRRDRDDVSHLDSAQRDLQQSETTIRSRQRAFQESWISTLPDETVPPTTAEAQARWPVVRETLQGRLDGLRENERKKEDKNLESEINELGKAVATLTHQRNESRIAQNALLQKLEVEPETSLATLPERFPELAGVTVEGTDALSDTETEARGVIILNRSDRSARAKLLGIGEEPLKLSVERETLGRLEKRRDVRVQAGVILGKAREAIVGRVMPNTIHNMNRLLPLLTEGRYHQAEWDRDSNSLSIYDNQARGFQRKTTFSGGARDQISLALRLAFAMATLPGEHAVRPGWLFLDEPLSSFDRERTQALVKLLTKGLIRQQFDQIFLISHSESFDSALFEYRLQMENGTVKSSNLPTA